MAKPGLIRPIQGKEVEDFWRDGGVCLRGVVDPSWLDGLARGTEQALAQHGPHHYIQSGEKDPGFFYTEYFVWKRIPEFRDFALNGPGGEIVARLTRSAEVHFFMDGVFVKEPRTERPSAWHQDQVYYPVDGQKVAILWFPLDPVPADTALRVVQGSHAWGKWYDAVMLKDDEDVLMKNDKRFEAPPDFDAAPERYTVLSWDVQPGDCIAFHGMAVHGARGNTQSGRRRRAVSTTWLGDDTVFGQRGEIEDQYKNLNYRLGERLTDERNFPRVWPR
jgi:ectoine hydroxylase-related dioxygenase (phytanoyl-CoA dioxygenase family)